MPRRKMNGEHFAPKSSDTSTVAAVAGEDRSLLAMLETLKKERAARSRSRSKAILDNYMHDCELEKKALISVMDQLIFGYDKMIDSRILWPQNQYNAHCCWAKPESSERLEKFKDTVKTKGKAALTQILKLPDFSPSGSAYLAASGSTRINQFEQNMFHEMSASTTKLDWKYDLMKRTELSREFFNIKEGAKEKSIRRISRLLQIPVETWGKPSESCPKYQNSTCSICLQNYIKPDICVVLPCGHYFHICCAYTWLFRYPNCPTCRAEIDLSYCAEV